MTGVTEGGELIKSERRKRCPQTGPDSPEFDLARRGGYAGKGVGLLRNIAALSISRNADT